MIPGTIEYNKFRESVFTLHAVLGIASLKAVELELADDHKEIEQIRKLTTAYYNKFHEGINEEYIEAMEDKQEHLQKVVEKFVKRNIK